MKTTRLFTLDVEVVEELNRLIERGNQSPFINILLKCVFSPKFKGFTDENFLELVEDLRIKKE